ncbi:MAG: DUF2341 domain-containing protein, partial [Candidatus Omnitrophica bacterium]|nr:DUF2341 domain-containing protein [Candidatus Omnitrophota bacterium]
NTGAILYVADTAGFAADDNVVIDPDASGGGKEICTILSVQDAISLTMTANLTYTHLETDADKVSAIIFVDEANDDFHLASNDTGAKDLGTDLTSDANLAFSDDIDGDTRPVTPGTWDIGADESNAWYPSWLYRKKITIDHTKVDADLTDFPVLISFTDSDVGSHAKLNGDDLLFTSSDSSTKLAHEIEKYTSGTGELIAWVKTDLSSTADTVLYMYYGNAAASNQENPTAVWSNDFVSVWHMKEDPGPGGVDEIKDSLGVNHGNAETSMETEDQVPGQIDGSLDFDGGDDKIYIGATGMPTDTFTFGGWIKSSDTHEIDTESTSGTDGISGQKYAFSADHQGSDAGAGLSVGTNGISVYEHGESYLPAIAVYSSSIGSDWNYILVVYDSKQPTIYLNGVAVHTGLTSPRPTVYVHSKIGGGSYGHLNGIIDEARISSTARTAGWIATTYNNQDAPSTFMGFEDEEGNTVTWDGGGGGDTDWSTPANWTNNTVPTAGDIAVFDNTSDNNCVIDAEIAVGGIDINAGYDGAISQGANIVTVSHFEQDAGTFTGGSAAININSNFVLGAGAFTATSGTTTISGSFTKTGGTFTHNSGAVTFDGTSGTIGITSGGATFYALAFNDAA